MNILVAGVTAERQYIPSYESWRNMKLRDGDAMVLQHGTRGDVARTIVCNEFLKEKRFDALMLCDLDQKFPVNTVEKLREWDKDMVSGHYMKRTTKHLLSIWQYSVGGGWPYMPFIDPPDHGLWKIATTGMGCVLIKREVIEAVASILPPGSSPFEIGKLPEAAIPQANFGSDYRFFYLARKLGYKLFGDASVDMPHASTLWITRNTIKMLQEQRKKTFQDLSKTVFENAIRAHGMITQNAVMSRIVQLKEQLKDIHDETQKAIVNGQLMECEMWLQSLKENEPSAEATELWKEIYRGGYSSNRENNKSGFKLPMFASKKEAEQAIANRGRAISGEDEEEARKHRVTARQNQNKAAAERMNGKGATITSTEQGTLEYLE